MNDINKLADSTTTAVETTETTTENTTTNPVQQELENIKKKGEGRTELEKAEFTLKKNAERVALLRKEAGVVESVPSDDENRPLTVGDLNRIEREKAHKTALTLAEETSDEHDRELLKYHLQNTIKPSGDPQTDLKNARALVYSVKNTQIAEEVVRSQSYVPSSSVSAAGAPAKKQTTIELTPDEMTFKRAYGLTDADIIDARKKAQAK